MKILYLVHPEQDYLCYMMFSGFCNSIGEDNIILYPFKLSYIGNNNVGYVDFAYMLHNENKRGMTCSTPYITPRKLRIYPMEEVVDEMASIDLIVLSSPRHYPVHALRFIKQLYGGKVPRPLAFIDGEDSDNLRDDLIAEFNPQFIFKRELTQEIQGVYPLPFSAIVPHLDFYKDICDLPKTLDIFALFGNTHRLRSDTVKFLMEQNYVNSYIGIDSGLTNIDLNVWHDQLKSYPLLSYFDYLKKMGSAKINIVIRGHGCDTVRYFEAASFETLLLIKDPGIVIPNPYIDGVHCVYWKELWDLKEKIDYYLAHEDERLVIAKAGKAHTIKYHTNCARAEYFLDIIKGKING